MNKLAGKKGSYDISRKTLYFIIVLVVLAFIFIYMAGTISKYYKISEKNKEAIMGQILLQEAIYSKNCFAYYDETTGRAYPGIIDQAKFEGERSKWCKRYIEDVPYKISMQNSNKVIAGGMLDESTEKAERGIILKLANNGGFVYGILNAEMNDYYLGDSQDKPSDNRETLEQVNREIGENIDETATL